MNFVMQTVASLAADLDGVVAAAIIIRVDTRLGGCILRWLVLGGGTG